MNFLTFVLWQLPILYFESDVFGRNLSNKYTLFKIKEIDQLIENLVTIRFGDLVPHVNISAIKIYICFNPNWWFFGNDDYPIPIITYIVP